MSNAEHAHADEVARVEGIRRAIHDWIRDDVPLAGKMNLMPEHVSALVEKIVSVLGRDWGESKRMREAAKIACLDNADAYREASEQHLKNRDLTKAQQAIAWADGAMMCAHAVAKLPLDAPETSPHGGSDA